MASTTAFCQYLIGYYTKYFPGNFFVNYAILGVADMLSMPYQSLMVRANGGNVPQILQWSFIVIGIYSLVFICLQNQFSLVVPVGIFILRCSVSGAANFNYHVICSLFPTEYRALATGGMNFVSRGFSAIALIVVEYTSQPIVFVLVLTVGVQFVMRGLIREPKVNGQVDETRSANLSESFNRSKIY